MSTTVIVIGVVWFAGAIASYILVRRFKEQRRAAGEEIAPVNPTLRAVVLGGIVLAIGVVAGPGLLAERRHDAIVESGKPATARIVAVEETGNLYNRRPEVEVRMMVQPGGGEPFESQETWVFSVMDVQTYAVGAEIDVFYDPQDPSSVAVVGSAGNGRS
jgi:hypothetical protein